MLIRFTRGIANTPAGTVADFSRGAACRLVRQGAAEYVEDSPVSAAPVAAVAEPETPAPSDHKASWVEYAVSAGYGYTAAKAMTKRELIEALS